MNFRQFLEQGSKASHSGWLGVGGRAGQKPWKPERMRGMPDRPSIKPAVDPYKGPKTKKVDAPNYFPKVGKLKD